MKKPKILNHLCTKYYNAFDIYDGNAPLFFCFKWFGIIPLENVCEKNIKLYKVSKTSKCIKYIIVIYSLVVGSLFVTNVLQRKLKLVDEKTIYFADAYGLSIVFISIFAMLGTDSKNVKNIPVWYSELEKIDLKYYLNRKYLYKNTFKTNLLIVFIFLVTYTPLNFTFIFKIFLDSQPVHLLISLIYQLSHVRDTFILYLMVNAAYILLQRFKIINTELIRLSKLSYSQLKMVNCTNTNDLFSYLDSYNELQNLLDKFNSIYGILRATSLLSIYSEISYGAFIILAHLHFENKDFSYGFFLMYIWWEIGDIILVSYPIYMCEKCLEQVSLNYNRKRKFSLNPKLI